MRARLSLDERRHTGFHVSSNKGAQWLITLDTRSAICGRRASRLLRKCTPRILVIDNDVALTNTGGTRLMLATVATPSSRVQGIAHRIVRFLI